jgi:p-cumate 2,3-dioxygenase beta subunit
MSAATTLAKAGVAPATRAEVEDFLYAEAALLDEWRLDEWFALFAPGSTYEVPTAGAPDDDDSAKALFYIADDYVRLRERVARLGKREAHAEFPRSRLRRMVSNVRVLSAAAGQLQVACNLVCYRAKNGKVDTYRQTRDARHGPALPGQGQHPALMRWGT